MEVHGTAVALDGKAVLLRGASGAGKSDLALRLIEAGAVLVADDQVELTAEKGQLWASPPPAIAGLIEIRQVGIRRLRHLARAPLCLLVDLLSDDVPERLLPERLPERRVETLNGIVVPVLSLSPFEASTAAKLVSVLRSEPAPEFLDGSPSSAQPPARPPASSCKRVLFITGMSGAGRSTALKQLEDLGYEAVDNLPVGLLPRLTAGGDDDCHPVAVGLDVRTREFSSEKLIAAIDQCTNEGNVDCRLVFLDCDDDVLARRFTETRRPHPLAGDRPVSDGIALERRILEAARDRADLVIDTSALHLYELRRILTGRFALDARPSLKVFVTSFSFRQGLPREADLVFDVRFLDNPFYDPALRAMSGLDQPVASFVAADPSWQGFFSALTQLLGTLLPRYDREGKSYLTIAIGCTGGRHRSVFAAERLARHLASDGLAVSVGHRDIDRPVNAQSSQQSPVSNVSPYMNAPAADRVPPGDRAVS